MGVIAGDETFEKFQSEQQHMHDTALVKEERESVKTQEN